MPTPPPDAGDGVLAHGPVCDEKNLALPPPPAVALAEMREAAPSPRRHRGAAATAVATAVATAAATAVAAAVAATAVATAVAMDLTTRV